MVSVIVLTWNRANLLRDTVNSVLNQTYTDFELLIVDNESTDETEHYVTSLEDDRVKYFRHANQGIISVNRNLAIDHSQGEFVSFCDDDDLWETNKLEAQMAVFEQHPQVALVCSNGLYFSEKGVLGHLVKRKSGGWITLDNLLSGQNEVVMSSATVRRNIFAEVGMWDVEPAFFTVEDYNLWVRIAAKHQIYFISEPLVQIRVHEAMSSHKDTRIMISKVEKMFAKLHEERILSAAQYQMARRNVRRRYRMATFKELLKRLPFAKNTVNFFRRTTYALRLKERNT